MTIELTEQQKKAIEAGGKAIESSHKQLNGKGFKSQPQSEKREARPFESNQAAQSNQPNQFNSIPGVPSALGGFGSADQAVEHFLNQAAQAVDALGNAERHVVAQDLLNEANRFSQDVSSIAQAYIFFSDVRVKIAMAKLEALAQIEAQVEADTNFFSDRLPMAIEVPVPRLPATPSFSSWQRRSQE